MTIGENRPAHDTSTDIRHLLDAGYEVTFQRWTAGPGGEYFANITSEYGSRWKGLGATPGEALRSVWPLGYDRGQGGCGHCGGVGCTIGACPVCAAYADEPSTGTCGVCGYVGNTADGNEDGDEYDEVDPYCSACGQDIAIFWGHGDGWHHWRVVDGRTEIYDAGHVPAVAWRTAGAQ